MTAVQRRSAELLVDALTSPASGLCDVRPEYVKEYLMVLEVNGVTRASLSQVTLCLFNIAYNLLMLSFSFLFRPRCKVM